LLSHVKITQKRHPGLPLTQLRRPREQLQPLLPNQPQKRTAPRNHIEIFQRFAAQYQRPHLALSLCNQRPCTLIPIEFVVDHNLLCEYVSEQSRIEISGQVDTLFALALPAT